MNATLFVKGIRPQKDQYRTPDGAIFDDVGFAASPAREAELIHFKRFKIEGHIQHGGQDWPFIVLVSLRGHLLTFSMTSKDGPLKASHLLIALEHVGRAFRHRSAEETQHPVQVINRRAPAGMYGIATVVDGFWFADVMHHIKDMPAGFSVPLERPQPFIM